MLPRLELGAFKHVSRIMLFGIFSVPGKPYLYFDSRQSRVPERRRRKRLYVCDALASTRMSVCELVFLPHIYNGSDQRLHTLKSRSRCDNL